MAKKKWQESEYHRVTKSNPTSWDDDKTESWFSIRESHRIEYPSLVPIYCLFYLLVWGLSFKMKSFEWGRECSLGSLFLLSFFFGSRHYTMFGVRCAIFICFLNNFISFCWSFVVTTHNIAFASFIIVFVFLFVFKFWSSS